MLKPWKDMNRKRNGEEPYKFYLKDDETGKAVCIYLLTGAVHWCDASGRIIERMEPEDLINWKLS